MMDIEKLIEKLQNAAGGSEGIKMCHDAATALSTLQAENEKLRDELGKVKRERDAAVALVYEWEQYGRYLSPMGFTVPPNWRED